MNCVTRSHTICGDSTSFAKTRTNSFCHEQVSPGTCICVADFLTTQMRCQKIGNTDTLGTNPTNSYVDVYNSDASLKNWQCQCVVGPQNLQTSSETCIQVPGNLHKNSSIIYIRADTMGQENKIKSHQISTDTRCLMSQQQKNSHTHARSHTHHKKAKHN